MKFKNSNFLAFYISAMGEEKSGDYYNYTNIQNVSEWPEDSKQFVKVISPRGNEKWNNRSHCGSFFNQAQIRGFFNDHLALIYPHTLANCNWKRHSLFLCKIVQNPLEVHSGVAPYFGFKTTSMRHTFHALWPNLVQRADWEILDNNQQIFIQGYCIAGD